MVLIIIIDLRLFSALVVESVHSVDALTLVVASQQINVLREFDLVGQQQRDRLNGLLAAVDVITDEQKLLVVMRIACNVKQPEQVEVLSVHVTKDFDRCLQIEQHWFRVEHLDDLVD